MISRARARIGKDFCAIHYSLLTVAEFPAINYQIHFVSTVAQQLCAELIFPRTRAVRRPIDLKIADLAGARELF